MLPASVLNEILTIYCQLENFGLYWTSTDWSCCISCVSASAFLLFALSPLVHLLFNDWFLRLLVDWFHVELSVEQEYLLVLSSLKWHGDVSQLLLHLSNGELWLFYFICLYACNNIIIILHSRYIYLLTPEAKLVPRFAWAEQNLLTVSRSYH